MNYKQKLGYTLLGAGIMALGIIIGQLGTPDIEAQSNGVFDKITCREIEVVDEDGNKAIVLAGQGEEHLDNHLTIYYPRGLDNRFYNPPRRGMILECNQAGTSAIDGLSRDRGGRAFQLIHYPDSIGRNALSIWNQELGGTGIYQAIDIECNKKENRVFVRDRRFEENKSFHTRKNTRAGMAIGLHSHLFGNEIFVVNPHTGTMRTLEDR